MNPINNILLITLFSILFISCDKQKELFQEDSDNWLLEGNAEWEFDNNELTGTVTNDGFGYLITKEKYDNFELNLEFMPDSTINSGVFIRCEKYEINPMDCYEVNIWDLHPKQDFRTGAVVLKSEPLDKVETINQWNTYKIIANENHIKVWINKILTIDLIDNSLTKGHIAIQAAGEGEIKFKNIRISETEK